MVIWGVAHEEVIVLLPMSQDTLQAITQEMLMIGCSAGITRNLWSAIEERHSTYGYNPPLAMRMWDFPRYSKAVASVKGLPSRLLFPIGVHHIHLMLQADSQPLAQLRNTMLTVLETVTCMRVSEVAQLQLCDLARRGAHQVLAAAHACP